MESREEKKDQEHMELLQRHVHLKKCYDNLTKQYDVAKEVISELEGTIEAIERWCEQNIPEWEKDWASLRIVRIGSLKLLGLKKILVKG